jgi:hypothetical protein
MRADSRSDKVQGEPVCAELIANLETWSGWRTIIPLPKLARYQYNPDSFFHRFRLKQLLMWSDNL